MPSREHRCAAVEPPVPLSSAKQRQLCLADTHLTCATYEAAIEHRGLLAVPDDAAEGLLWPSVRTTPVVLEPAHVHLGPLPVPGRRAGAQLLLAGLLLVAFLVLALPRWGGSAPAIGGASPSPAPSSTAAPSPSPAVTTPTPTVTPSGSPAGTAPPASGSPSVSPGPSVSPATTTYRVQPGDTLVSIAAAFDTTVRVLVELNALADPSLLRVGQVLQVPAPGAP